MVWHQVLYQPLFADNAPLVTKSSQQVKLRVDAKQNKSDDVIFNVTKWFKYVEQMEQKRHASKFHESIVEGIKLRGRFSFSL